LSRIVGGRLEKSRGGRPFTGAGRMGSVRACVPGSGGGPVRHAGAAGLGGNGGGVVRGGPVRGSTGEWVGAAAAGAGAVATACAPLACGCTWRGGDSAAGGGCAVGSDMAGGGACGGV